MLKQLKQFNTISADLEELVEVSALGRAYRAEFETVGADVPEWLDTTLRTVRKEIKVRMGDSIENRLREAKARRASLGTPEEKRQSLDTEIAKLEQMVGVSS